MPNPSITILTLTLLTLLQFPQTVTPKLEPPILDQQIGQSIFHQNKLYLIYVFDQTNQQIEQLFNQYCSEQGKLCTYLSPQVDRYMEFKAFIGKRIGAFFGILDVQRRKKYVLDVVDGMTVQDLRIFQSKFQQGILQPFYASQQPQKNPYQKCQKLVGKTLTKFLQDSAQLKVIFLYTQHSACQICGQMLRSYADLAERLYQKQIVIFGYYDIFQNDHPRITDQILPYFLVFSQGSEEPYGLAGEKFHELEETIIQLALKNSDIDLEKFRREHKLKFGDAKPEYQKEFQYKVDGQTEQKQRLEQL